MMDAQDRSLLDNVRPSDWQNPTPRGRYHLVVVGAGTGGLVTAAIAVGLGARVALIERHRLGGDCLNVGCVPSKAIIAIARKVRTARSFDATAIDDEQAFLHAMSWMHRVRADISAHDSASRYRGLGVDVYFGSARFIAEDAVDVEGRTLRFRRAVVATGSRPAVPSIPGLDRVSYLTNESVFSLRQRPPRLVAIGAGPIGCELAQAFAVLGIHVTLVEAAERILPKDDADAAEVVWNGLRRDGVDILTGATVTAVTPANGAHHSSIQRGEAGRGSGALLTIRSTRGTDELPADALLIATGRVPNVEDLGLNAAGVEYGRTGITVDARLRTTNRRIYAIGDVNGGMQFTHAADAQARAVIANALFWGRTRVDPQLIPWCTYTSPELAHVGVLGGDTRRAGDPGFTTMTVPMAAADRARIAGADAGFLRLHVGRNGRIAGATLVADGAGEMIGLIAQAMGAGTRLDSMSDLVLPYPTRAEIVRKAADQWRRRRLGPRLRRVLAAYFRWTGRDGGHH